LSDSVMIEMTFIPFSSAISDASKWLCSALECSVENIVRVRRGGRGE
jgi:hypothetical protein